ncbi:MAG TPA: DUF362 domain-containing protein [Nitrospirae bacterium]|nr:DUF362 domain-containing protein [Nitrospirota bacterium]
MPKVIVRNSTYEYPRLREDVFNILASLDAGRIMKDTRVLIKPNMLAPAHPDSAMTTHPLIVKAVAEYALQKGAAVQVSDSLAMGSFPNLIKDCGFEEALSGMPLKLTELTESRCVKTDWTFGMLELSTDALDAEVIINLPKLKTHSQMALTLAIKNLFGCVVGARKPEWHFRVGENKELFAELLASIYGILTPSINLMDGILAMEGQGPGRSGSPRHLGVLLGSTDALSMDKAVCMMFGLDPGFLMTNRAAARLGLDNDQCDPEPKLEPEIEGPLPDIGDFRIPDTSDLLFGPRFARGFLRRHIASRPVNLKEACKYCNECVKICPAEAIANTGNALAFDYNACIRCYCCIEVCPHAAMVKYDTFLKKALSAFIRHRREKMGNQKSCKTRRSG